VTVFNVLFEKALICAPPTISIDFDDNTGVRQMTVLRSPSEVGEMWAEPDAVRAALSYLKGASNSPLPIMNGDSNNSKDSVKNALLREKQALTNGKKEIDGEQNNSNSDALLKFGELCSLFPFLFLLLLFHSFLH
jgi:hypothetical protein